DHFAYGVLGDWLWEVGNNLSGVVTFGHVQRQADISETQVERLDMVKTTTFAGTAGYLVTPGFRLRGGLAGIRDERTEAIKTEARSLTATAAAEYISPLANTIGLAYRNTRGEAPVDTTLATAI